MSQGDIRLDEGLGLRPARDSDSGFLEALYRSTRDDLMLLSGDRDFVEALIDQQFAAQTASYASNYPNAMQFVVEKQGERIGRVTLDFGEASVHLLVIEFIREVRGRGYGTIVINGLQRAAAMVRAPLTLWVSSHNLQALALYQKMGFQPDYSDQANIRMLWYPHQP